MSNNNIIDPILDFKVLLQAVEHSPSTIIITDTLGNIEYVNPKFTKLTGYTKDEVIGSNPSILKSGEHSPEMYRELWKTIYSGKEWTGVFHNKKKNGELYWESARIAPVKDAENKVTHFIAIKEDVTLVKKMQEENFRASEEAEASNMAKSQFLANMSHEIRTPLNGIKGMIDLTLLTELTEEQKENLLIAEDCVNTLMNIINDILDFSKIEAGKAVLENEEINIKKFVQSIIKPHNVKAKGKGLGLYYNITEDIPEFVTGDSGKIKQILNNLLSNSIKFTEEGKVELSVYRDHKSYSSEKASLVFKVEDTGIGMDEEGIKHLFKSFSQVDGSITRKYGGTGLGLAISKALTNMMGGDIIVESIKGKGSAFYVSIILKEGALKGQHTEIKREKIINPKRAYNILVVDDDKINQRITMNMLKSKGHEVYLASSGVEALNLAKDNKFDLILMDIQMPEMDGIEATKLIRKYEEEKGIYTPIIALTAYAIKGDRERFLNSGMDDYISKPFRMENLFSIIGNSQLMIEKKVKVKAPIKAYSYEEVQKLIKKIKYLNKAIQIRDFNIIEKISTEIKEETNDMDSPVRKIAFKIQMASRRKDIKSIELLFNEIYIISKSSVGSPSLNSGGWSDT